VNTIRLTKASELKLLLRHILNQRTRIYSPGVHVLDWKVWPKRASCLACR